MAARRVGLLVAVGIACVVVVPHVWPADAVPAPATAAASDGDRPSTTVAAASVASAVPSSGSAAPPGHGGTPSGAPVTVLEPAAPLPPQGATAAAPQPSLDAAAVSALLAKHRPPFERLKHRLGAAADFPPTAFRPQRTPAFPLRGAPLAAHVPLYVMVAASFDRVAALVAAAAAVSDVVDPSVARAAFGTGTRLVLVRVRPFLLDNTGCDAAAAGFAPPSGHEWTAHYDGAAGRSAAGGLNCSAWAAFVQDACVAKQRCTVLDAGAPLPFGPSHDFVRRHALATLRVPRYLWAHTDVTVDGPEAIARPAMLAATLRLPFCVLYTDYDSLAVFDAVSQQRHVGDWDSQLWYQGDVDFYDRCTHAGLPQGALGTRGVHHDASTMATLQRRHGALTGAQVDSDERGFTAHVNAKRDALPLQRPDFTFYPHVRVTWALGGGTAGDMADDAALRDTIAARLSVQARRWVKLLALTFSAAADGDLVSSGAGAALLVHAHFVAAAPTPGSGAPARRNWPSPDDPLWAFAEVRTALHPLRSLLVAVDVVASADEARQRGYDPTPEGFMATATNFVFAAAKIAGVRH